LGITVFEFRAFSPKTPAFLAAFLSIDEALDLRIHKHIALRKWACDLPSEPQTHASWTQGCFTAHNFWRRSDIVRASAME
jgi:hypothetical protein